MTGTPEELERRLQSLELVVTDLALRNVDLLLVLEILVKQNDLDRPIEIGNAPARRPSELLDELWTHVFEGVVNRDSR